MHAIIAVIHEDPVFNESNFSKFCWDNEEYYERNYITDNIEESITKVEEYEKYLRDNINKDMWYGEKLTALLAKESDLDRIKFYAENEYQEIDENGCLYEKWNPLGFCDWFVVGGRWANMLYDYNGIGHNTLSLSELNVDNPNSLDHPYGVVKEYLGEEELDTSMEDQNGREGWLRILEEAKNYSSQEETPLYITLVDIHQ